VIFCPENKDVVLFPEKIGGEYVALHRPNAATPFCRPEMWIARSPDLIHWGRHESLHGGGAAWLVGSYDAILMANHGVVTCGPDLARAYFRMETVEHFAKISLVTELLGRQVLLSETEVDKLLAARQRYFGAGTPAIERSATCPVTDGVHETPERFEVSREDLAAMVREAVKAQRAAKS
jgi:hypothetical protein